MIRVFSVENRSLPPLEMPERFRREVVYFMTPTDRGVGPVCGENEYWIRPEDVRLWLEEGVFSLVSPLDAESKAEIELSEDQERWLEWMEQNKVFHIRLQ